MSDTTFLAMQNRLMQIEGSFSRLLNHLPGLAYRCKVMEGYDYTLEFVNKGSKALLGLEPEEMLGQSNNFIERLMPEEDLPRVRATMLESLEAGKSYEMFYRVTLLNGESKWVWDQGEGVFDENGKCTFIEGIMMDVTEQKNKELKLWEENQKLRQSIKNSYGLGQMVGKSEAMQNVYSLMIKAAKSDTNVVLYGETGVGKDLAARTIHELNNSKGRYVPVNCAAIPDQLLESEFFGHIKGAFSGATSNHSGYLAAAHGGTLFLDEIAELPLKLQVKLLRAIESKTYTPVGSADVRHSNFRLISATNQDLNEMLRQHTMRPDFFYRIHVLAIHLPPLRDRHGDLPLLIDVYARERGIVERLPGSIRVALEQYTWPGNVRELQNTLDRYWAFGDTGLSICSSAIGLTSDTYITGNTTHGNVCFPVESARILPSMPGQFAQEYGSIAENSLSAARGDTEKKRILATLDQHNWRKGESAAALGVTLRTLQRKIKRYNITQ